MTANHAIVRTECGDAECEAWLYVGIAQDVCYAEAAYALVRMAHRDHPERYDPAYPEGFHAAHVCALHAMAVLDKSEGV